MVTGLCPVPPHHTTLSIGDCLGHEHDSELLADGERLREDLHDLLRSRVGRNVIVGGLAAQQQVADASAGEVGLVSAFAKGANDFGGVLFSARHRRSVSGRVNYNWSHKQFSGTRDPALRG